MSAVASSSVSTRLGTFIFVECMMINEAGSSNIQMGLNLLDGSDILRSQIELIFLCGVYIIR